MSKIIQIQASKTYDILIGQGLLSACGEEIAKRIHSGTAVLITDDKVYGIYGKTVEASLKEAGFKTLSYTFNAGEASKSLSTLGEILEFMASRHVTRSDFIVALGGGVAGDMAGFAAAVYLRGIRFVQLPTTLLAAVDSSVGGKTAVNLKAGKNLAGAFCQPDLVICDYAALDTLAGEDLACGLAEVIKYGVLNDKELFVRLRDEDLIPNTEWIIERCVESKKRLVMEDEFDTGARQLLNLGHTLAHAIEPLSNFSIMHGQAVAIGMAVVAKAAYAKGLSKEDCYPPIVEVLKKYQLPFQCPFKTDDMLEIILSDKKRAGSNITLVIPDRIGSCYLHRIPVGEVRDFFEAGLS